MNPEVVVSPVLGQCTVLHKANEGRLWWNYNCQRVYDSGRPLQPWWLTHLDVLMAERHVVFIPDIHGMYVELRAVVTVSGCLLLPQLDALYRADIDARRNAQRRSEPERAFLEGTSDVAMDRTRPGIRVVCRQSDQELGQQADLAW